MVLLFMSLSIIGQVLIMLQSSCACAAGNSFTHQETVQMLTLCLQLKMLLEKLSHCKFSLLQLMFTAGV